MIVLKKCVLSVVCLLLALLLLTIPRVYSEENTEKIKVKISGDIDVDSIEKVKVKVIDDGDKDSVNKITVKIIEDTDKGPTEEPAEKATEQPPRKDWGTWLKDRISFDGQILPLVNLQEPSRVLENPDNDFMKLERRSWELHLRPNLYFKEKKLKLGIRPRCIGTYKQYRDGTQNGKNKEDIDVFINEAYIQWHLTPSIIASLQRKNLQWGNGFLISPSNLFYKNTGKTRPDQELPGKDFAILSYTPSDWLSVAGYANLGQGEYKDPDSLEKFRKAYAINVAMTFESFTLNPVISYEEKDRLHIGGYGTWTVGKATLLFFDCTFAQGTKGRYVEVSPGSPFGLEFKESKDHSNKIFPQILLGGSYTFLNGTTVYLEYLYHSPGYGSDEKDRYYRLLESTESAFLYRGSDPDLQLLHYYASGQLYDAYQSNLVFKRRNYLMLYATHSQLWKRVDITAGWVQNIDDRSFYAFGFIDFKINDSLRFFSNSIGYSNISNTEFHSPLKYIQTLGLRYHF